MRILYFSRNYTVHDYNFLLAISKLNDVWFLQLEKNFFGCETRPLPSRVNFINLNLDKINNPSPDYWVRYAPTVERVLGEIRPDLVHAGPTQNCGFLIALLEFHPFMLMPWGSDILIDANRDSLWKWATIHTLKKADMVLCDCDAVKAKVKQLLPYPDDRIVQFPWGVDVSKFSLREERIKIRKRLGWEKKTIILSIRNWEPIYGIDTVLKAFHLAYLKNNNLRLLLLSNGSLAADIEQYIADNSLSHVIHRPGRVMHEEIVDYFSASDLYLSCSKSDGSSISLLEAMACGIPIVVTDIPANKEWITDGENGWLAPADDNAAFSHKLLQAASLEEAALKKIFSLNRQLIEKRANWHNNIKLLDIAYNQLLFGPNQERLKCQT